MKEGTAMEEEKPRKEEEKNSEKPPGVRVIEVKEHPWEERVPPNFDTRMHCVKRYDYFSLGEELQNDLRKEKSKKAEEGGNRKTRNTDIKDPADPRKG